jgi:hypothetical protein
MLSRSPELSGLWTKFFVYFIISPIGATFLVSSYLELAVLLICGYKHVTLLRISNM